MRQERLFFNQLGFLTVDTWSGVTIIAAFQIIPDREGQHTERFKKLST